MKKLLLSMAFVAATGFTAFATYVETAVTDLNAQTGTTATGSAGTGQGAAISCAPALVARSASMFP